MTARSLAPLVLSAMMLLTLPLIPGGSGSGQDQEDLVAPDEGSILLGFDPPTFSIEKMRIGGRAWSIIDLEGGIGPPTDGEPSVPVLSHPLILSSEIEDMELKRAGPREIFLSDPVPPSPDPVVISKEASASDMLKLSPDLSAYSSDGSFPEEPLLWAFTGYGWENGERLAHYSVTVSPFDYQPSSGKLTCYDDLKLIVRLQDGTTMETSVGTRVGSRAVEMPSSVHPGTELLVISYGPFINDLEQYVEWKREKGICVSIVPIADVTGAYPAMDGPSAIWQFVHDTYFGDGQNLRYLLLAGETKYVPSRMVKDLDPYYGEPSTLPSDTYFGCLDGTYKVWDADDDGQWAELGDVRDYVPEVYVSRISLDSDTEAANWAAKTVNYERTPASGAWSGTAGLFGSYTHYPDDGPRQCEYLWGTYLDTVYATPDRYYSDGSVKTSTGAKHLDYYAVDDGFRNGLSIVVYMGHGLPQYWSEGPQDASSLLMSTDTATSLSQSPKLPYITAMSCETNWFDGDNWEAISEGFTEDPDGGAIAYVGASRTTEGGIGYYEYTPGAPGIQEDVLRMMKDGMRHSAEIFQEAKAYYVDQWGAYFGSYQFAYNAWVEHNILGDAETPLWTSEPKTLSVSYDYTLDHFSNFTVTVTEGAGVPLKDALVSIYSKTLEERSVGVTDAYGKVTVPFVISEDAYGKVTVTKYGYRPYQKQVVLTDDTGPTTSVLAGISRPDGANGWYTVDPEMMLISTEPGETFYKWNTGPIEDYKGTLTVPKGSNWLEFWSEDTAGNEEPRKGIEVKYDPDTPVLQVSAEPEFPDGEGGWYITRPVVSVSLDDDPASPERADYWWDRSTKQACNGTIYPLQGDHTLHIQAIDEAGNRGEELIMELKVDSIVPLTELSTEGIEPNALGWYTEPMTITLSCDDRSAEIYSRWSEEEEWEAYTAPISPPSGNHTLYFHAEDLHGNSEPVSSFQVPYDISPPQLAAEITPGSPDGKAGWYRTGPVVALSAPFEDNQCTIYFKFEGDEPSSYYSPIEIPEGKSSLACYAVDEAGNTGNIVELNFKVDTKAETTTATTDRSPDSYGWYLEVPLVTLSTNGRSMIHYSWSGGSDLKLYSGPISPPGDEGMYNLAYYSIDDAGNQENTKYLSIKVDSLPPSVQAMFPEVVKKGGTVTFDLSQTSDGIGIEEYFIDFGDGTDSGWVTDTVISHTYSQAGTFKVSVQVRDIHGNVGTSEGAVTVEGGLDLTLVIIGAALIGILFLGAVVLLLLFTREEAHHHHPHPAPPMLYGPRPMGVPPYPQRAPLAGAMGRPTLPPAARPAGQPPGPLAQSRPPQTDPVQQRPPAISPRTAPKVQSPADRPPAIPPTAPTPPASARAPATAGAITTMTIPQPPRPPFQQ